MEDIKMTASKAIYARLKPELDAAFSAVMGSMDFEGESQRSQLAATLKAYLGVAHAEPCASGSDALRISLLALGLPEGAEVIMPAFNTVTAAQVVASLGLKPVFADVNPHIFTLEPAEVERAITPATAAILPVHLFGQCAPMSELMKLAEKYKLWVVEDATQAFGAMFVWPNGDEEKAGAIGHIGITSFFPSKPTEGAEEGAAAFTNNDELGKQLQGLASGRKAGFEGTRLDALQATMLNVKVGYADEYNTSRQQVARIYDNAFAGVNQVQAPHRAGYSSHTYLAYTILMAPDLRNSLQQYLRDQHIPSMVYCPEALHLQDAFKYLGYKAGDFPVTESLSQSLLSLPMHSELKEDQLAYICQHVVDYVKQNS